MVSTSGSTTAHFLKFLDIAVGATAGFYVPFSKWARNDDCFSNFIGLADSLIEYHVPFDGEGLPSTLLKKILFFGANTASLGMDIYGTYTSCVDQY